MRSICVFLFFVLNFGCVSDVKFDNEVREYSCQTHDPSGDYLWMWSRTTNSRNICPERELFVLEWNLDAELVPSCTGNWELSKDNCSYYVNRTCGNNVYQFEITLVEIDESTLEGYADVVFPFVGRCSYNLKLVNVDELTNWVEKNNL